MPLLAAALVVAFLLVVFPLRELRLRRSGGAARRGDRSETRPRARWVADGLVALGFALLLAGPALEASGAVEPLAELPEWSGAPAVAVAVASTLLAVWAQETMGAAWVADIAPRGGGERPVSRGPFALVRNPSYCAMLGAGFAGLLLALNIVTAIGWLVLLLSLALTARAEEPLLLERFGEPYRHYATRTGRFFPGVGRLRPEREPAP